MISLFSSHNPSVMGAAKRLVVWSCRKFALRMLKLTIWLSSSPTKGVSRIRSA